MNGNLFLSRESVGADDVVKLVISQHVNRLEILSHLWVVGKNSGSKSHGSTLPTVKLAIQLTRLIE